jgi:hypothetical protein
MMRRWGLGLVVFLVSLFLFSRHLLDEPYFMDEGAYIAGTYYYRLMKEGEWNHVDWFHLASYDHLNVGRAIIGGTLDGLGIELPNSIHPLEEWYGINGPAKSDSGARDPDRLLAARVSMMVGGAIGCWAIFALANELIGPVTGFLAALLLGSSPLYWTHARRAMADDWVIAFGLVGLTSVLFVTRRMPLHHGRLFHLKRTIPCMLLAGVAFGLSSATKLSGLSLLMGTLVGGGFILAKAAPWRQLGPSHAVCRRWGIFLVGMTAVAGSTFLAVHPFFYAHPILPAGNEAEPGIVIDGELRDRTWVDNYVRPLASSGVWERLRYLVHYRQSVLDDKAIQERFSDDALPTARSRIQAMFLEGWGRRSFAAHLSLQDFWAGALVGLLVLSGFIWTIAEGRRHWRLGLLPIPWLVTAWFVVETFVLVRELSLNWDRYYMGWITLAAILAALGISGPITSLSRKLVLLPPIPTDEEAESPSPTKSN